MNHCSPCCRRAVVARARCLKHLISWCPPLGGLHFVYFGCHREPIRALRWDLAKTAPDHTGGRPGRRALNHPCAVERGLRRTCAAALDVEARPGALGAYVATRNLHKLPPVHHLHEHRRQISPLGERGLNNMVRRRAGRPQDREPFVCVPRRLPEHAQEGAGRRRHRRRARARQQEPARLDGREREPVWKSNSESGAPDNSSQSHFSAMTLPCWLR